MSVPNPVLENPFALLSLSADASGQEIALASTQAKMRAKLAGDASTADKTRSFERAAEQLHDPVRRFDHSLFWVELTQQELVAWRNDPHLTNLATDFMENSAARYLSLAGSGDLDARNHNLAVLYLGEAIARDSNGNDVQQLSSNSKSQQLWKQTLQHWHFVIRSEAFWSRMNKRCAAIDDPRLSSRYIRQIRKDLPYRLLHSCQQLASARLLNRDAQGASFFIAVVRDSPFASSDCDACLREIYNPLADRIEQLLTKLTEQLREINRKATSGPDENRLTECEDEYSELFDNFVLEVQPDLDVVLDVGDLPGFAEEHARDLAAKFLRSLSVSLHNADCNPQLSQSAIELAVKFADTQSLKERLAEENSTLRLSQIQEEVSKYLERDNWDAALLALDQAIGEANTTVATELKQFRAVIGNRYATTLYNDALKHLNQHELGAATVIKAKQLLSKALKVETDPEERKIILRTIRNVEEKLRQIETPDRSCFVATATFDTPDHETVIKLRKFRDEQLRHVRTGRAFITFYYWIGPNLAWCVRRAPSCRRILAPILTLIANRVTTRTPASSFRQDPRKEESESRE